MTKKIIALAAASALGLAVLVSTPKPADAHGLPLWLGWLVAIPVGSVLVNDVIMLHCQHRLLTWQEVGPSLIPIISQDQLLKSGACPRPAK